HCGCRGLCRSSGGGSKSLSGKQCHGCPNQRRRDSDQAKPNIGKQLDLVVRPLIIDLNDLEGDCAHANLAGWPASLISTRSSATTGGAVHRGCSALHRSRTVETMKAPRT